VLVEDGGIGVLITGFSIGEMVSTVEDDGSNQPATRPPAKDPARRTTETKMKMIFLRV
jgi:hypothetical protein